MNGLYRLQADKVIKLLPSNGLSLLQGFRPRLIQLKMIADTTTITPVVSAIARMLKETWFLRLSGLLSGMWL